VGVSEEYLRYFGKKGGMLRISNKYGRNNDPTKHICPRRSSKVVGVSEEYLRYFGKKGGLQIKASASLVRNFS
jgi:hypothetical protein